MIDTPAPCPFCGATNVQVYAAGEDCQIVRCLVCSAHGPVSNTRREAIAAWNRAAAQRARVGPSEVKHGT